MREDILKNQNHIKTSRRDIITKSICGIICILLLIIFIYPLMYVFIGSFYYKKTFSFDGYLLLLKNKMVIKGLVNSILYSTIGTSISVVLTIMSAFALSNDRLRGKTLIERIFFYIPFHISGGIITTYIVVRSLGLLNTVWALVLPFAVSYRNLCDLKARFENGYEKDLFKVASLDGCGPIRFLTKIGIPLLSPSIMLVAFRYFMSYWGNYFYAQIFITDREKYLLSLVLNELLVKNQAADVLVTSSSAQGIYAVQMAEFALIVISSVPILVAYIFASKNLYCMQKDVKVK